MTWTRSLALVFYLGTALAGAAIGITVDRLVIRPQPRWWDQGSMRKRLFDALQLTEAQRQEAARVLDERNHASDSLVAPMRAQLDSVSSQSRARLKALLTPEQQAIFDKMQREREQAQRTEKK
jgi:Spy/CpxP family protein refolding chaperone